MDRIEQVNWLRELAGNMVQSSGSDAGTAEEIVEYFLSDEGRETWGIEIPDWFTDHDWMLLVRFVEEAL